MIAASKKIGLPTWNKVPDGHQTIVFLNFKTISFVLASIGRPIVIYAKAKKNPGSKPIPLSSFFLKFQSFWDFPTETC